MSKQIEVIIKPENEIDKQEVETLIKALKEADITDNARVMLKEMEKEQDEARIKALQEENQIRKEQDDPYHQKEIQSTRDKFGDFNNIVTTAEQFKKLEHIVKPFRIILTRVSNQLLAVDAFIEYQKTGDGLKVTLKVGATIIADRIFQMGVVSTTGLAITAFIATAIASVSIIGAVIVGVVIFIGGVAISWWVSKQIEKLVNYAGGFMIDYIREVDFYFTEEEVKQMSVAHCHKTMERNIQRFSRNYHQKEIFINGINVTDKLYPNPYILPDKAIIPQGFSNTWRNLTEKQLEELNDI